MKTRSTSRLSQAMTAVDPYELVHVDARLSDAVGRIREGSRKLLFVVDGDELVGTLSTFDIVVRAIAEDRDIAQTAISDIMSKDIPLCRADWSVRAAARAMAAESTPTLAVLDDEDELLGTVHARHLIGTDDDGIIADVVAGLGNEEAAGDDGARRRSDPTGGRMRGKKAGGAGVYAVGPRLRKARG